MDRHREVQVLRVLPRELRIALETLPTTTRAEAEELRLRLGRAFAVTVGTQELELPVTVTREHLELLVEQVTRGSYHAASEQLRAGFVTIEGGHRVGWTGTAVVKDNALTSLRDFNAAAIRLAREVRGVAGSVIGALCPERRFVSTLIVSPPGLGKTTLLRDLVRLLGSGSAVNDALRVGLADERGEVAALWQGQPMFDVGARTDVLQGGNKADSLLMLLRSMAPQVLAVDEITAAADTEALRQCAYCGTALLATAHAADVHGFWARLGNSAARELFQRYVVITRENGQRRYRVCDESGELLC